MQSGASAFGFSSARADLLATHGGSDRQPVRAHCTFSQLQYSSVQRLIVMYRLSRVAVAASQHTAAVAVPWSVEAGTALFPNALPRLSAASNNCI